MTQNQPDPPFTQQQSTFNEKFASDLPQEMNQIPSLEPTITDHESETDISELSFFSRPQVLSLLGLHVVQIQN